MPASIATSKTTIKICDDPRLTRFPSAIGPINEFETKIATKLVNNADSGLNDSHIKTLQNLKVFQVAARGTPKSMLWLDNQMLKMKCRIIQIKQLANLKITYADRHS